MSELLERTIATHGGPEAWHGRGVFEPDRVWIDGGPERREPHASFRRLSRRLRWDELDLLYFAGYAWWNYLAFPFMLERPRFRVEERPGNRLAVSFPDDFPTHSPIRSSTSTKSVGWSATTTQPASSAPGPGRPTSRAATNGSTGCSCRRGGGSTCGAPASLRSSRSTWRA